MRSWDDGPDPGDDTSPVEAFIYLCLIIILMGLIIHHGGTFTS